MKSRSFRSLLSEIPSFYGMTKLAPRVSPGSLFEALEERKMLTLLGLVPAQPLISYNSTGVTTYTAGSDSFDVSATPLLFLNGAPPKTVDPVRDFELHFKVDSAGNFAGGIAGDDFILEGNINTDGVPGYEYTGTLLTAEVTAFGWVNGGTSDNYDVRLQVTGGALAPLYAGSDLGITILSEHSNFNGDFTVDFTGGAKGNIGAVPTIFNPRPAIDVIKYTNGTNNDNPTTPGVPNGPIVPVGSVVTWDYTVTNPGNEPIAIDKLTGLSDDNGTPGNTSDDFYATYVSGDINNNSELDLTESWSFTASGVAVAGQYENYGTVTGTSTISNTPLTASNVDHYFAVDPKINIVKLTNGTDNDSPTGPYVQVGSVVTWTYNITNPGDEAIRNVVVTDNIPGVTPTYVSGDTDLDNQLDLTETWVYTASGVAVAGQYANVGTVTGNGVVSNIAVNDDNPDHYYGVTPGIDLEKFTNGVDATSHANAPLIAPGATVTWTYQVTNTGGLAFTQAQVVIVDDAGTPGNTADDFSTTSGDITLITATDVGSDGILSAGEVWTYTASGVAQNLGGPVGSTITIDMSGSSSLDGPDGNIRTFSAGGVSVKASAWSREKGAGDNWSAAYLGSYGGGLGVTDSSEGSGGSNSHTVDNVGRDNYVLFEFDQSVVVDSAFLGYVVGDSDIRVWIGNATDPYNNHLSLNDATLAGLGFTELNLSSNGNTRTADFNSGNLAGNVLVIAASPDDTTPDDCFKIDQLNLRKTDEVCYENYAVVTVPGATDNDNSFYCNPEVPPPQPGIDLEKTTNGSTNTNPTAPDYDNEDAANGAGVPVLAVGSTGTWTYKVTNTGNVSYAFNDVVVSDDNGTPGDTSDDMSTTNGQITFQSVQTGDADNILEAGEVWIYQATGVVADQSGPTGSTISFDFSGSSSLDGSDGNIRKFNAGGVSVNASAWSRDKSNGSWDAGWLGSYGGGLGVTDSSEGSGGNDSHTVDNIGRDNYVLFEFDQSVVVDSAFLGYVVGDSDLRVWIGSTTDPFNNHLTLSDATLTSLGFTELNLADNGYTRTADFNDGNVAGNVLVIAASPDDTTPEDRFKIERLCLKKSAPGIYENTGKVTVPGASDTDLSHYRNPSTPVTPKTGKIIGNKYQDVTGNGLSSDDTGLGGVKIKLYKDVNNDGKLTSADGAAIASTYTASGTGYYEFTGLANGNYLVQEVVPDGWVRTGPALVDYVAAQVVNGGTDNTDNNFANFDTNDCTCNLSCVYYVINGCRTVYDLTGNVTEGDTVTVYFNLDSTETLSLVSYTAPSANFVASEASQQVVFDFDTKTFGPGKHSLTVEVPCSYFQIDFVCGPVIDKFGPEGSNIFYTPQGRLIDADNGGSNAGCGFGSIAGSVYYDKDNDGVKESGEPGIGGVKVVLTGTNDQGQSVNLIRYTNSSGDYKFTGLRAGNYKLTETQPDDYLDGKEKAGSKGGNISVDDVISSIVLASGNNATGYNFGEIKASSLCGYVYNDKDNDGVKDWSEDGISGVKITLTGTNDRGQSVSVTTYTDSCGKYSFANLRPGTYKLTETQPSGWNDGKDSKGSLGGSVYNDYISSIKLGIDKNGYNYNFGERSKYRSWC